MMNCMVMLVVVVVLAAGCSKHEAATQSSASPSPDQPAPSASVSTTQGTPPVAPVTAPAAPTVVAVPGGGDMNATVAQLTRELHRFIARNHSAPSGFEDFVAAAHLQVPPPPPGKKYAISSQWKVVLVDR